MKTINIYTDFSEVIEKECKEKQIEIIEVFYYHVAPFIKIKGERSKLTVLCQKFAHLIDEVKDLEGRKKKDQRIV